MLLGTEGGAKEGGEEGGKEKSNPPSSSASFPSVGAKRRRRSLLLLLLSTPSLPLFSPLLVQRDSGGGVCMYFQENTEGEDQFLAADRRGKKREREERERSAYVISAIWQHTSDTRKRKWSVLCASLWETKVCVCAIQALRAPAAKKVRFRRSKLVFLPSCSEKEKKTGWLTYFFSSRVVLV